MCARNGRVDRDGAVSGSFGRLATVRLAIRCWERARALGRSMCRDRPSPQGRVQGHLGLVEALVLTLEQSRTIDERAQPDLGRGFVNLHARVLVAALHRHGEDGRAGLPSQLGDANVAISDANEQDKENRARQTGEDANEHGLSRHGALAHRKEPMEAGGRSRVSRDAAGPEVSYRRSKASR